jgi:hypothetical protein
MSHWLEANYVTPANHYALVARQPTVSRHYSMSQRQTSAMIALGVGPQLLKHFLENRVIERFFSRRRVK